MRVICLKFMILALLISLPVQSKYDERDWKGGGGDHDWEPLPQRNAPNGQDTCGGFLNNKDNFPGICLGTLLKLKKSVPSKVMNLPAEVPAKAKAVLIQVVFGTFNSQRVDDKQYDDHVSQGWMVEVTKKGKTRRRLIGFSNGVTNAKYMPLMIDTFWLPVGDDRTITFRKVMPNMKTIGTEFNKLNVWAIGYQ